VTFILNILHKDMSILAADQKAVADWPSPFGFPSRGKAVSYGNQKIVTNLTGLMAIGASGYSEHNSYIGEFERSEGINEGLSIIRNHMEAFLLIDNRPELIKSASQFENECIASFYDNDMRTFFTNEFKFNEFSNGTRLHRASDDAKIFCAGSGRDHFDISRARVEVNSLVATKENSDIQDKFISWVEEVFKRVSETDEGCGAEPMFAVSTRENHAFRTIEIR
jgi:hypothetical protein